MVEVVTLPQNLDLEEVDLPEEEEVSEMVNTVEFRVSILNLVEMTTGALGVEEEAIPALEDLAEEVMGGNIIHPVVVEAMMAVDLVKFKVLVGEALVADEDIVDNVVAPVVQEEVDTLVVVEDGKNIKLDQVRALILVEVETIVRTLDLEWVVVKNIHPQVC